MILLGLVVERQRALGEQKLRAIHQLDQRLGALLETRHGLQELWRAWRIDLRQQLRAALGMRQEGQEGSSSSASGVCGYNGR